MRTTFLFVFFPVLFFSQMVIDRPGEGADSEILEPKKIQLESDLVYYNNGPGFTSDHLLRFGLSRRWEVGAQTSFHLVDSAENSAAIVLKYNLLAETESTPTVSLRGETDLQIEEYSLLIASAKKLSEKWSTSAAAGFVRKDFRNLLHLNCKIDHNLTENWALFSEYYSYFEKKDAPVQGLNVGSTLSVSPRVQVFLAGASNFKNFTKDYFVSTGFSFLLN